jgi:hypothetical protein
MSDEIVIAAQRLQFRRGCAVVLAGLLAGLGVGCSRDEVVVYEVPKESAAPSASAADGHTHETADPHGGMAMPARLEWDAPAGWQAQPASGMRLANYLVPAGHQTGQVSVVVLPQVVGRDLEVLNIFRERLQAPPLASGELAGLSQEVVIGSATGRIYDMAGESGGAAEGHRLLVAVWEEGGASYYFNFYGPSVLVDAEKPRFLAMLKSVKPAAGAPAAGSPTGVAAVAPPAPAPDSGAVATTAGGSAASDRPRWEVPEGWRETPPTQMLLARFEVGGELGKAEITVSMFPGDVGGTVANVNRWRRQIGLGPWTDSEVNGAMQSMEVEGGTAMLVELVNDGPGGGKRLIGVVWPRGSHTWFYKLVGDDAVVSGQKAALIRFVQSVRHGDA